MTTREIFEHFFPQWQKKERNTRKNKQQQKHSAYPSISLRQFKSCTVGPNTHSHTPGFWTQAFEFQNCFTSYNSARSCESLAFVKHHSSTLQFVEVKCFVKIKNKALKMWFWLLHHRRSIVSRRWCCALSTSCSRYCICSCGASVLCTAECTQSISHWGV